MDSTIQQLNRKGKLVNSLRKLAFWAVLAIVFSAGLLAQAPAPVTGSGDFTYSTAPQPTVEDTLRLQLANAKFQLAQALAANAKCEDTGPQSSKLQQEAETDARALVKSLGDRGLAVIDNKIVPKPAEK